MTSLKNGSVKFCKMPFIKLFSNGARTHTVVRPTAHNANSHATDRKFKLKYVLFCAKVYKTHNFPLQCYHLFETNNKMVFNCYLTRYGRQFRLAVNISCGAHGFTMRDASKTAPFFPLVFKQAFLSLWQNDKIKFNCNVVAPGAQPSSSGNGTPKKRQQNIPATHWRSLRSLLGQSVHVYN